MPIPISQSSLYGHVMLVQAGLSYSLPGPGGTVSKSAKPGADDTLWNSYNVGEVDEFKIEITEEESKIYGGQPGGRVITGIVPLSREFKATFQNNRMDALSWQLLTGSLPLTGASDQANHLERRASCECWLKAQLYDADNTLRVVMEKWGRLKVTSAEAFSGNNVARVTFEFLGIRSTLDSIAFS